MRIIFLFLIVFCPLYIFAQNMTDSIDARISNLIIQSQHNSITDSEKKELRAFGYKIQNKGFLLVENQNDYKNALTPIDSAISFWQATRDTANEANLRKYRCFLLSKLGKFTEAKSEGKKAIELYTKVNSGYGVAVSEYNLSFAYSLENHFDSALVFQRSACEFWNKKKNSFRIITNNTHLLYIYTGLKQYSKAEQLQATTSSFIKDDTKWQAKIEFYYISYQLFTKTNSKRKAESYKELYEQLLLELEKKKINTKSKYDI